MSIMSKRPPSNDAAITSQDPRTILRAVIELDIQLFQSWNAYVEKRKELTDRRSLLVARLDALLMVLKSVE